MIATLGEVCQFLNGGTPSKDVASYFDGDIPWITSADIVRPVADSARSFITEEAIRKSATNKVKAGTVLLVTRTGVGKVAIAGTDLCFSQDITALIPDPGKLVAGYLVQYLRTKKTHFERHARGATIKGITRDVVADLAIPLPPLPEQIRIAAILDKADALRVRRREALAQLDSLTQAIFIDMFGDPASNPKGWLIQPLSALVQGKPNNGIFKKNEEYGEGLPVVWVGELFTGNSINCTNSMKLLPSQREVEQYGLNFGDILFCRSSLKLAGIGYNNVYLGESHKALFECHVIRITPDKKKLDPQFLNFALRMPSQRLKLFKHAKTVTMTTIDQDGLLRVDLPVPPLQLQEQFTEKLNGIERLKAMHTNALVELEALFSSLQGRAFRNEI